MARTDDVISVRRADFERALAAADVPHDRADAVWTALAAPGRTAREQPRSIDGPNVFFYLGGLVVILGLTVFAATAWDAYGAGAMLAISLAYAAGFVAAGRALLMRGWTTPGGLSVTAAVAMVPLAVYAFQAASGLWPDDAPSAFADYHHDVRGEWVAMEGATIAAAAFALRRVRFPFLVAPLAFSAWYLSMDLAPLAFGEDVSGGERAAVSIAVGLAMLAAGFLWVDRRGLRAHAFWLYLFGLAAFFGGTVYHCYDTSSAFWWLTATAGVVCLFVAVLLERRVFAAFGGLAIASWLGYLSDETFDNAASLPFVLTAAGVALVAVGMVYQRRRDEWRNALIAALPPSVLRVLPPARD
jgi:hypothetical protein